jgi:hypothetical protein
VQHENTTSGAGPPRQASKTYFPCNVSPGPAIINWSSLHAACFRRSQDIWSDEACRPGGQINARFEGFESSLDIGSYSVRRGARGNDSDVERFPPNDRTRPGSWITRIGRTAVAEIVREIQATDPARPLGKISKRQRAALRLQSELGDDLLDRPAHWLRAKDQKPE